MTKVFYEYRNSWSTNATQHLFEKGTTLTLLDNSGKTPLRIDKILTQVSSYHLATGPITLGVIVSISDAAGACFDATITSMTYADLTTLMNNWSENIWMTDLQIVGSGSDENAVTVMNLEADTRRILKPGRKLFLTVIASNFTTEAAKNVQSMVDNIIWYSQAAE